MGWDRVVGIIGHDDGRKPESAREGPSSWCVCMVFSHSIVDGWRGAACAGEGSYNRYKQT